MKKQATILMAVAVAALLAVPAMAAITSSAHDFSAETWATNSYNGSGEICLPCHVPHHANAAADQEIPLWAHTNTANSSFTLYTSDTLDATLSDPTGVSKVCLGCHDGSVSVDAFGGRPGGTTIDDQFKVGSGGDLGSDHPIGFIYDADLASTDTELFDPETEASGITASGTIEEDMLFGDTAGSKTLECASCHDVHNTLSDGNDKLLLVDNASSALCLTCHDK